MAARAARATAKREQIGSAALRLFLANGYAGTSMDAVTEAAGVSKQTLYSYFPTKLELLSAVLEEELAKLEPATAPPPPPETLDDLRATLLGFATGFTGTVLTPEALASLRLVLGEVFHIPELRDSFRRTFPARVLGTVAEILRHSHSRGLIAAPSPELTARMFVGALMTFVALDGFLSSSNLVALPSAADLEFIVDSFLTTVAVES